MTPRRQHVLSATCLVAGVLAPAAAPLHAGTLHVPGDAPTIQQAINLSNGGDTILVAPGTYLERIDLLGKGLILQSDGGAAVTTIDGQASGTVVTVNHASPVGTTLRGFTITGGAHGTQVLQSNGNTVFAGGGVFVGELSSLSIDACVITGNTCDNPLQDYGGGVGTYRGTVKLTGCTLTANSAEKGSALGDTSTEARLRLFDCTVSNNLGGPAIQAGDFDGFLATRCVVKDNAGSGVVYIGAAPSLSGCTFSGNAGWGCQAISIKGIHVTDCSFLGNGLGAMFSISQLPGFDTLTRCVFANGDSVRPCGNVFVNECTFDGAQIKLGLNLTAHVVNSIARNVGALAQGTGSSHLEATYSDVQGGAAGVGNTDVDPQWVNGAAHDYHLSPGSPCIDAGNPAGPIDGNLSVVDQGAFPLDGWNDLGGGQLASSFGVPHLAGQGLLVSGQTVGLALTLMPHSTPTVLVTGLSQLGIDFKGGVLWPSFDLVVPGLVTDAAGNFSVAATWPAGVPSGTTVRMQFLVQSATAPQGIGLSNAVSATAP